MPFCPQCNHANHHSVSYCASCGFQFLPNVKYPTPHITPNQISIQNSAKANKVLFIVGLALVVGVIGFCGIMAFIGSLIEDENKKRSPDNSNLTTTAKPTPQSVKENQQKQISSKEHLELAKKALNDNYKPNKDIEKATFGNITLARQHLLEIRFEDAEYPEAQKLYKEIEKREAIIDQLAKQTARTVIASQMEKQMLSQGFDMTFKVSGKANTVLTIEYILMSRPVVYKIENETELLPKLRNAGFKKVILTNGYDKRWWFTWD